MPDCILFILEMETWCSKSIISIRSQRHGQNCPFCSKHTLCNTWQLICISPDKTIRSRINKGISTLAGRVSGEYAKLKGRKRQELDSKSKLFHIYTGETVSVADIKKENSNMRDEFQEWKKTCKDIQNDIHTLYEEIETAMQEKDEEISNLHSINEELKSYIDSLKTSQNSLYNGKHVSEVKKNQEP
jgi:chromosome segregation ATPase